MKTRPVNLVKMNLADFFQFIQDFISLIEKIGADKLKIQAQFILLKAAFLKFDEAYKKERKNGKTDTIVSLDKLRDGLISAILGIIKGYVFSKDAGVRDSAEKLKSYFDSFKGITRKSFKAKSGYTTNLLQGFEGKYSAEVELLGLGKLIGELSSVNKEIIAVTNIRVEEWAEDSKMSTIKSKKEIVGIYRMIEKLIDVFVGTDGEENYSSFIQTLNVMIAGYSGSTTTTNNQANTEKPAEDQPTEPTKPITPPEEPKYPDAKEWHDEIRISQATDGEIYFITVEGSKMYYKLLDKYQVSKMPTVNGIEGIWEKLDV